MDVLGDVGSLKVFVASEDVLFTGLSGLGGDFLLHGVAVGAFSSLQSVHVGRERSDRGIGDLGCESLEFRSCGDKVGLATEADKNSLSLGLANADRSLGSLTVSPLGGHELTFFADDVNSLLEIAFSLDKGLLAIHHTSLRHLTKLHYIFCSDVHCNCFLRVLGKITLLQELQEQLPPQRRERQARRSLRPRRQLRHQPALHPCGRAASCL